MAEPDTFVDDIDMLDELGQSAGEESLSANDGGDDGQAEGDMLAPPLLTTPVAKRRKTQREVDDAEEEIFQSAFRAEAVGSGVGLQQCKAERPAATAACSAGMAVNADTCGGRSAASEADEAGLSDSSWCYFGL